MFKNKNYYYYDLFIRYSNLSILSMFLLYNKSKYIDILNLLNRKLPIFNNFNFDEDALITRKIYLFIGKKNNLKNIFSFFGEKIIFFKTYNDENFIKKIDFFLFIQNYNIKNPYNIFLKNIYLFNNFKFTNNYFDILNIQDINYLNNNFELFFEYLLEDDDYNEIIEDYPFQQINIKNRQIYFIKLKRYFYKIFKKLNNKKIKKKLHNIKNINITKKLYLHELTLKEILKNNFFLNTYDLLWLKQNNYIYLNGYIFNNFNYIIKKNDRIQLKLNYNILILNRFNISILIKKHYKTVNYYNKYLYYNNLNFNKNIFLKLIENYFDIFKFLEVDYVILTIFILYKPISKVDYNFFNIYYKNIYKLNLLNWRILY